MLLLCIAVIVLVCILCIPIVQAAFIWIAVFFVAYAPSIITIAIILLALIILPVALLWSIYGAPVLLVLAMLAIFAIWSPFARWLLWPILIIGLLLSIFYQPTNTWLHVQFPALTEWQSDSRESANIKLQESSLSMKDAIRDSRVTIGTFGRMNKNSVGYDDFGHEANGPAIKIGQAVKSMGKFKPQNKENGDQGLVQIALPNLKTGEFVNVRVVWVPIQSVTWGTKEEEKAVVKPPPATPPPTVVPPPETKPAPTLISPPKEIPPPVPIERKVVSPQLIYGGRVYERLPAEVFVPDPVVVRQQRWDRQRFYQEQRWRERQERRFRHEPPPYYYYYR